MSGDVYAGNNEIEIRRFNVKVYSLGQVGKILFPAKCSIGVIAMRLKYTFLIILTFMLLSGCSSRFGENFTIPGANIKMIWVAPGTYKTRMRYYPGPHRFFKLFHITISKGFWIGKYEITQKEYKSIMGDNPSGYKGDNQPVEMVSWSMATEFCKKLTDIERQKGRLPKGYIYRLPTSAEWEFAARGGIKSKGFTYSGSNDANEVCWHGVNAKGKPKDVGLKKANELGIHDMSGNVWEWCFDRAVYKKDVGDIIPNYFDGVSDPVGQVGSEYIIRGASCMVTPGKVASLWTRPPSNTNFEIGYRIVLAPAI